MFVRWRLVSRVAEEPGRAGVQKRGSRGSVFRLSALGFVSRSPERQGRVHVWPWEVDREISVQRRREGSVLCAQSRHAEGRGGRSSRGHDHVSVFLCFTDYSCVLPRDRVWPVFWKGLKWHVLRSHRRSVHGDCLPLPGRQVRLDGAALGRATRMAAVGLFHTSGTALLPVPLAPTVDRTCHLRSPRQEMAFSVGP